MRPFFLKAEEIFASFSSVISRARSSLQNIVVPRPGIVISTGTISCLKWPNSFAFRHRVKDWNVNWSVSDLVTPYLTPRFSAVKAIGTRRAGSSLLCWNVTVRQWRNQGITSALMSSGTPKRRFRAINGDWLMDSAPPAKTILESPTMICWNRKKTVTTMKSRVQPTYSGSFYHGFEPRTTKAIDSHRRLFFRNA